MNDRLPFRTGRAFCRRWLPPTTDARKAQIRGLRPLWFRTIASSVAVACQQATPGVAGPRSDHAFDLFWRRWPFRASAKAYIGVINSMSGSRNQWRLLRGRGEGHDDHDPSHLRPARGECRGLIDFTLERERHRGFVGGAKILARLDELPVADRTDRSVVVTGGPGMGKSALLAE